jgi:hypothetical protein
MVGVLFVSIESLASVVSNFASTEFRETSLCRGGLIYEGGVRYAIRQGKYKYSANSVLQVQFSCLRHVSRIVGCFCFSCDHSKTSSIADQSTFTACLLLPP